MAKTQKPATLGGFDELWIAGGAIFALGFAASLICTLILRAG